MIQRFKKIIRHKQALSLSGSMASAALNFIGFGLLARILSKEDLGSWFIFLALFNFFDQLRTGIVHTSLIKFSTGNSPEKTASFNGSALLISLVITLFLLTLTLVGSILPLFPLNKGMALFFTWFPLIYLATLPINFSVWLLQAAQKFDKILYVRIISQGSFVLFFSLHTLLTESCSLNQVLSYYLMSNLLAATCCILLGWSHLQSIFLAKKEQVLQLLHFGKYSMGTLMGSNLLRSSDTLLIGSFLGPTAVALYGVPQKLIELIEIPLRSFLATAMPQMAQKANQDDLAGVADVLKKYAGTLTLLLLPIVIGSIVFAQPLIVLLGGPAYADSAYLLRIFIIYAALLPLDRFSGVTLDIINKPHLNFMKTLIMLGVNIIGDLVALHFFGEVWGVAFVSVFTFLSGIIIGHSLLQRYLPYRFLAILGTGVVECKAIFYRAKNLIYTN